MSRRPRFHVTAPKHWLNDPNGPLYWNGRWHLFYQHNPAAPAWGPPHWGHVSSTDLLTWQRHPIALAPSTDGPDRDGCWSGCARVVDGVPTIFYTGVVGDSDDTRVESVMRATPLDRDLVRWVKDPDPVIKGPSEAPDTGFHRDPYLLHDGGDDYLLLGSSTHGPDGPTGTVLIYRGGPDGTWTFDGVMFDGAADWVVDTGPLWECPQLLRFPAGDVLIVSVQDPRHEKPLCHVIAFTGRFGGGRFLADQAQLIDRGHLFYAPAALSVRDRWLIWGWVQDPSPDLGPSNPNRCVGALSLPREVTLEHGRVQVSPAAELIGLRVKSQARKDFELDQPSSRRHVAVPSSAELTFAVSGPGALRLDFGRSWAGEQAQLVIDQPLERSQVRVYVDGDIIEVYAPGQIPYTTRAQPHERDGITFAALRGPVQVTDVMCHELKAELPGEQIAPNQPSRSGRSRESNASSALS
jgi:beta-fructofuranosidase